MLDLKKNRIDYGTLLMPPEGYALTHAVATTYSLDLFTLLAIPVALFYSKVLDGNFQESRFDVLESIQQTANILTIYCQKGKIKVPRDFNWLFAFVEDSICEITPADFASSFHPKVWILRFKKSQEIKYRVMVLSRNLTFDRSWDLAFHLEGQLTKRSYASNKPLLDFVEYLFKKKKAKGADLIKKELSYVSFESLDGFKSISFHPIGIDDYQLYRNPLEQRVFDDLLIVSPFVDVTTLKKLHKNSPNLKTILSREEELQKIPPQNFQGYEPYFLSRRIVDGEAFEDLDETGFEPQKQQLHAKLFIGEKKYRYFWFLGSANCTDPAYTRNTEFMVELEGDNDRTGPDHIKNILITPEDDTTVFEPYEPVEVPEKDESDSICQQLRKLEYELINTVFIGTIIQREKTENYDLSLVIDLEGKEWNKNIIVKTAPLNFERKWQPIMQNRRNELLFENLSVVELSKFVVVSIYHKEDAIDAFLVKMQIELPESRKDRILKSLISSRENFFKYLHFLLSDNPYIDNTPSSSNGNKGDKTDIDTGNPFSDLPILEHLMLTASRNPDKLKSIDRLVKRLSEEELESSEKIIPEDFNGFWNTFKQVAGIK